VGHNKGEKRKGRWRYKRILRSLQGYVHYDAKGEGFIMRKRTREVGIIRGEEDRRRRGSKTRR